MLNTKAYYEDTTRFVGMLLNHDDSVTDRSKGSKLDNSHKLTKQLWEKRFGESYSKPGAMYRGQTPQATLTAPHNSYVKEQKSVVLVEVDKLHVLKVSNDLAEKKIAIKMAGTNSKVAKFLGSEVESGVYKAVNKSLSYLPEKLELRAVISEPSCVCKSQTYKSVIDLTKLSYRLRTESRLGFWKSQMFSVPFELPDGEMLKVMVVVSVAWGVSRGTKMSYELRPGTFSRVKGNTKALWGPVDLPGVTRSDDAVVTAKHRSVFIHSVPLLQQSFLCHTVG